jgi:hypothetical protein
MQPRRRRGARRAEELAKVEKARTVTSIKSARSFNCAGRKAAHKILLGEDRETERDQH